MLYKYDNKTLQFKQISIKQYVLMFLAIALIFSSLGFTGAIKLNFLIEKIPIIIRLNEEKFNEENLKKEIQKLNIDHPDIVFAQCQIESGNFTSNIWKKNNNCLGMKLAKSRPTTANGEQFGHAFYDSYKDCLKDYALWQAAYARNLSKEEYLQLLEEIYAEDSDYVNLIKQKL